MAVRLQFEGIRCFSTRQDAVVRPITLLVGENSSGKSTFLAIYRLAYAVANNLVLGRFFNEPPFSWGAYDQMASLRKARGRQASSFSIQICRGEVCETSIRAEFGPKSGQPALREWQMQTAGLGIRLTT